MTRRTFAGAALAAPASARAAGSLIGGIEHTLHWNNLDGSGPTWFHPRICRLPGGRLLMTMQVITGSDYFHPVHWSESGDAGRTWSEPQPVPGMGRHTHADGVEEGYCDTVPEFHPASGAVIAMAHNVYYQGGKLTRPNEDRWPVYIVRRAGGAWSPLRKLDWDHPEATAIYTSGCSQRVNLPHGDVLVPLSFGPKGRLDRGVTTVRCSFDGEILRVRENGSVLRCSAGRGLLEPSLALLDGVFYLTIRAENGQGFVSRSRNGLEWEPMRPWAWEDGETLTLSTTQQRWLTHSDGLFLVYTRRDATNRNVMRWRAPLWVAEVDRKRLTLIRATERVAIPMNADGVSRAAEVEHQGNFHTAAISPRESLISTGTVIPATWRGAVRMARVQWTAPNRLVEDAVSSAARPQPRQPDGPYVASGSA